MRQCRKYSQKKQRAERNTPLETPKKVLAYDNARV